MGAGVIPFAVTDGKVLFLFQKTFSGRKVGYLIDFGGGLGVDEDYRNTAIREFVEETETMYFTEDIRQAYRSAENIERQIPLVEALFEKTLSAHPHWWCKRAAGNPLKPKSWRTFFIEFPYRDIEQLNREWAQDDSGRFRKRRELHWITGDALLDMYDKTPESLWKRVRQLENARQTIREILQNKGA